MRLRYVYNKPDMTLNAIVDEMTDEDLRGFFENTMVYWAQNVDIFITVDELESFLEKFGFQYPREMSAKISQKHLNISAKTRGQLSKKNLSRIRTVFHEDVVLFDTWTRRS